MNHAWSHLHSEPSEHFKMTLLTRYGAEALVRGSMVQEAFAPPRCVLVCPILFLPLTRHI